MRLDQTKPAINELGKRIFAFIRELSGGEPQEIPSGDWYRATVHQKPFLYIRFIGERARTFPPHSLHLCAPYSDELLQIKGAWKGNNWYGSKASADMSLTPDPDQIRQAEHFVRNAFKNRAQE